MTTIENKQYEVGFSISGERIVTVEASSPEEAAKIAKEQFEKYHEQDYVTSLDYVQDADSVDDDEDEY